VYFRDVRVMSTYEDRCMAFTTADESVLFSESVLPSESKLLSDPPPQPDLAAHLVNIQNDIVDVIDSIISNITADDGGVRTTSAAPNTLDSKNVSAASVSADDDVEVVEIQNGNRHMCAYKRIH